MWWWIAETTVVVALLAGVAIVAGRIGRLGPATRHALWLLALVRFVTPPVLHWPQLADSSATHTPPSSAPHRPRPAGGGVKSNLSRESLFRDRDGAGAARFADSAASSSSPYTGIDAGYVLAVVWLLGTGLVAIGQFRRVYCFRRSLVPATAPPADLQELLAELAHEFGVRPPRLRVVNGIASPLLWCLGPSVLLIPRSLLERFGTTQWTEILAHELAHLRRGDPWFKRLSLLVGLLWWWNPLYWLVRRRLDIEAELACDAWVVSMRPEERLSYARTLVDVCELIVRPAPPSPVLGVSGAGTFLERRLEMIVNGPGNRHMTGLEALVALLIGLVVSPSWLPAQGQDVNETLTPSAASVERSVTTERSRRSAQREFALRTPSSRADLGLADGPLNGQAGQAITDDNPKSASTPPLGASIGSIDTEAVIRESEPLKAVRDTIRADADRAQVEHTRLKNRLARLEEARRLKTIKSDPVRQEDLERELLTMTKEFEQATADARASLAKRENDALRAAYHEIQEVVAGVAKARGLIYVVRISRESIDEADSNAVLKALAHSVVYADPRADITQDVIRELNRRGKARDEQGRRR